MKLVKSKIRNILKSRIDLEYKIKTIGMDQHTMNKKIFIEVLEQMQKIEDRRDFF